MYECFFRAYTDELTIHIVELVVQCFKIMQIGQTRDIFDSESIDMASLIN